MRDCYEADCTLLVSGPVTIPLDVGRFHYTSVAVSSVTADTVLTSQASPDGGGGGLILHPGGSGSFGYRSLPEVIVSVISIRNGVATVQLRTGPPPTP